MRTWRSLPVLPIFMLLLLAACGPTAVSSPTSTFTPTPASTNTPESTSTPLPTETPPPPPEARQITPCQPDPNLSGDSPYPAPTGAYQVGVIAFQLVDTAQPEPFTSDEIDYRGITIYVWYPAEVTGDAAPCSYASSFDRVNSAFQAEVGLYAGDVSSIYSRLRAWPLYAFPDATVSPDQVSYPVVLYSDTLSGMPILQSTQFQDLASHGYIAIDVIHTYGYPVDFGPVSLRPAPRVNSVPVDFRNLERMAGDDLVFVIDQLAELNAAVPENQLSGYFNLDQIGVVGWSSGGVAAVLAARDDERIGAIVTLDGEPEQGGNGAGAILTQPSMFLGRAGGPVYTAAEGPAFLVSIAGFGHGSYTDMVLWPETATTATQSMLGSIDGVRAIRILNAYIVAFFDQYLLGVDQLLLDGPSPAYPEVTIESRNTD